MTWTAEERQLVLTAMDKLTDVESSLGDRIHDLDHKIEETIAILTAVKQAVAERHARDDEVLIQFRGLVKTLFGDDHKSGIVADVQDHDHDIRLLRALVIYFAMPVLAALAIALTIRTVVVFP